VNAVLTLSSRDDDGLALQTVRPVALTSVYRLESGGVPALPVVVASPHSGRNYPEAFLALSRLDAHALRRSEDCYVDELMQGASRLGAAFLAALFPRAWLDANREPYELDPAMFDGPIPDSVNSRSPRVRAGLGTIPRYVANGEEIYRCRLPYAEAQARIDQYYHPYHAALRRLISVTRDRFGYCLVLDCHSMPTVGLPPEMADNSRFDMILGDCFGGSCSGIVTAAAESALVRQGYSVGRNTPYAGGFTTRHYGQPQDGVHVLQIEIKRSLYVDEISMTRLPGMAMLARHLEAVVTAVGGLPGRLLRPARI
jgi:N-formylglutamate amidohydrolase